MLVLVITRPQSSKIRDGFSFPTESTISTADELHLQPTHQTSIRPKCDPSAAITHFTPRERCRVQIHTVRFYGPNSRISTPPPPPPPTTKTNHGHEKLGILDCIQILLLFYCGWAHMEFLFALALGASRHPRPPGPGSHHQPPSPAIHHRTRTGECGRGTGPDIATSPQDVCKWSWNVPLDCTWTTIRIAW